MRKIIFQFSLLAILVSNTACVLLIHKAIEPEDEHLFYGTSQYSELEKHMEGQIAQLSSAKTTDLFYLCMAYSQLKKYNKLFPCLDQMDLNIKQGDRNVYVRLHSEVSDHSFYPNIFRAQAHIELGNYRIAVGEATKAYDITLNLESGSGLTLWGRVGKIRALGLVALSHAIAGDRENAQKFARFLELENVEISTWGYYPQKEVQVTELAKVYMALGDFDKAHTTVSRNDTVRAFVKGVSLFVRFGGESLFSFLELPQKFILYKSSYETGRVKEAKEGYDQLLKREGTKSNGEIYWMILFDRGRIAEAEGNLREAIEFYKKAIEVIEQQRSTINTEASKIGYVGNKQMVYRHLVVALVRDGQTAMAFEYVERSKARALVDVLAAHKDFATPTGNAQQIQLLLKELEAAEAERRIQDTTMDAAQVSQRRSHDVQIKEQLKAATPELASLVTVTTVSATDIQTHLRRDETLVEYYYQGDDLFAFIVTKDSVKAVKLNGAQLLFEIGQFRDALENPQLGQYLTFSQSLFSRLILPIEPLLKAPNLIIVPHGALHYLPFNALKGESGYLVERYSLRHLPSASVMNYLKGRTREKTGQMLAFGNPDLGSPQYDLKFAQAEVVAVAGGFSRAKVLIRKDATETTFKTLGSQFSYVHFATHGKFDPDSALNSGLLLASDSQNDGVLSVGELYSLRLDADLVTLSACETGLGKINHGDDVVGLARGFLYAGAKTIVASLWQVDDAATAALMTEFYANLKKSNKGDALRQAQLATKKKYDHPYYWAAFQLTGLAE